MGMDVYGRDPDNESGKYFRANVWYWRPLWGMIEDLYPTFAVKVPNAHYNDGDGLDAEDSYLLSQIMKIDIESGRLSEYVNSYEADRQNIPQVDCEYCSKTGYRIWPQSDGSVFQKECNVCSGTLKVDHFAKSYPMHIDVVKEFQLFMEHCGGFSIC